MTRHHTLRAAHWFLALMLFTTSQTALADAAISVPAIPQTRLEQAGQVSALARQTGGLGLFLLPLDAVAPAPYFQRDLRKDWLSASTYERTRLAERIGNQGRARFAAEQGWDKIVGSHGRGLVQGPDSVVWDKRTRTVRVLETKGGTSQLKRTFGLWQGTNRNSIRSAEFVLKSKKASPREVLGAARVIKAAGANILETGLVRTSHVLGTPDAPRLEGLWSRQNVVKEALEIERRVARRNPAAAAALRSAGAELSAMQRSETARLAAGRGFLVLGLAGSGEQSRNAWALWNDPVVGRTSPLYLHTGLAAGRWAKTGLASAEQFGLLGRLGSSRAGKAAGRLFFPIAIGVETWSAGTAVYAYSAGRISQREFYRQTTGTGVVVLFTAGGAIIGGVLGASAGGAGAVPGAAAGARLGYLVSYPFQIAADELWSYYYSKFDAQQTEAVDRVIERRYGVSSR